MRGVGRFGSLRRYSGRSVLGCIEADFIGNHMGNTIRRYTKIKPPDSGKHDANRTEENCSVLGSDKEGLTVAMIKSRLRTGTQSFVI